MLSDKRKEKVVELKTLVFHSNKTTKCSLILRIRVYAKVYLITHLAQVCG